MKSDKDISEIENSRKFLLTSFRLAVFEAEIAQSSLPSSNPIDVLLVDYLRRTGESKNKLILLLHPLGYFAASAVFLTIVALIDRILPNLFNMVMNLWIPSFYIILFIFPLIYWAWGLYRRIRLTFYTDFLKKKILRDLNLVIDYYTLLLKVTKPLYEEKILKKGQKEMEEFSKSVSKPKLFRNLTLGSLSSGTGILGIITTIVAQDYPLLGQISFESWLPKDLSLWSILLALIIPLLTVPTLVIMPLILGIRGAAEYENKNFRITRKRIDGFMQNDLLYIYAQRGDFHKIKSHYEKVLKENPTNVEVLKILGATCEKLERLEEAEKYYEKILKIIPKDEEATTNLVNVLKKLGAKNEKLSKDKEGKIKLRYLKKAKKYREEASKLNSEHKQSKP